MTLAPVGDFGVKQAAVSQAQLGGILRSSAHPGGCHLPWDKSGQGSLSQCCNMSETSSWLHGYAAKLTPRYATQVNKLKRSSYLSSYRSKKIHAVSDRASRALCHPTSSWRPASSPSHSQTFSARRTKLRM